MNQELAVWGMLTHRPQLQAMRDMYLVIKSTEAEHLDFCGYDARAVMSPGIFWVLRDFIRQFAQLFQRRRLFNAVVAAGVVNLAQQLCGVNVFAFYSGMRNAVVHLLIH